MEEWKNGIKGKGEKTHYSHIPSHSIIPSFHFSRFSQGFTLFEVLLAIVILAIAIAPMVNAFAPSLFATVSEETSIVFTNCARQTLNRIAVVDFKTLNTLVVNGQANPVNLHNLFNDDNEVFSFKGTSYTPVATITDASAGLGGLLEITVIVANQVTLKTLKADY